MDGIRYYKDFVTNLNRSICLSIKYFCRNHIHRHLASNEHAQSMIFTPKNLLFSHQRLTLITHGELMGSLACSLSQIALLLRVSRESMARLSVALGVALGGAAPTELLSTRGRNWPARTALIIIKATCRNCYYINMFDESNWSG